MKKFFVTFCASMMLFNVPTFAGVTISKDYTNFVNTYYNKYPTTNSLQSNTSNTTGNQCKPILPNDSSNTNNNCINKPIINNSNCSNSNNNNNSGNNNNNDGNNNNNSGNNNNNGGNNNNNSGNNNNNSGNNNNNSGNNNNNSGNNNNNSGNNNNNNNNNNNTNVDNENTSSSVSAIEKEVVTLVNAERAKQGLKALIIDEKVSSVARIKSEDMKNKGYFDHTSPTYGTPFAMLKQFNVNYKSAGENIAKGQKTAQAVVNAWMNSEGHRKNILNGNFTHIGMGYVKSGSTTYWTQMFITK